MGCGDFFLTHFILSIETYILCSFMIKKQTHLVTTGANWGSIPHALFETGVCYSSIPINRPENR